MEKKYEFKVLILFYLPFLFLFSIIYIPFEEAFIASHDFLDSTFLFYVVKSRLTEFFFDFNYVVPQFLNGLYLNALMQSDLGIGPNIFLFFNPATAHAVNVFILHSFSFLGLYLFISNYVFKKNKKSIIYSAIIALSFALLSHRMVRFGTVMLVPLLSYALANIYSGRCKVINWLIIILYPFYSLLHYGGYVLCIGSLILSIYSFIKNIPTKNKVLLAFFILTSLFLLVEIRTIYHWFFADYSYLSHRSNQIYSDFSFYNFLKIFLNHFIRGAGTPHFSFHQTIIFPVVCFVIFYIFYNKMNKKEYYKLDSKYLFYILLLLSFNSLVLSFDKNYYILLKLFNIPAPLTRIDVTTPFFWWVAFAISIKIIDKINYKLSLLIVIIVCLHSAIQFPGLKQYIGVSNNSGMREFIINKFTKKELEKEKKSIKDILGLNNNKQKYFLRFNGFYKFNEYFEIEKFKKIKLDIFNKLGKDFSKYRVMNIGISPTIAQYHGFYTLDGYHNDHSFEYGKKFNSIFDKEYRKDNKEYIKSKRVYYYISGKSVGDKGIFPDIDICKFNKMGGKIIFTRFPILNNKKNHLYLLSKHDDIHAYAVLDNSCNKIK